MFFKMQEAKNVVFQMRFPQKLWYLLDMGTAAILWGGTGRTILLNYRILKNYLQCEHSIFKTSNISSFIRQLNLYGFRKVTSHLQDPMCNSSNPYMHEFIHDNFQYGRPELLNKITRKAFAVKKGFKLKKTYTDHQGYISPLQKARRALHIALRKAAQDLCMMKTSKSDLKSGYDDVYEDYYVDEDVEFEWLVANNKDDSPTELQLPDPTPTADNSNKKFENTSHENLIDFPGNGNQQNNNFTTHFLSMPDLNDPNENNSGVLTVFNNYNEIDQSIVRRSSDNKLECSSLNCVLPSVSNEHVDDVSILEIKSDANEDHYNNEWDQMFNDMMSNKNTAQEGVSNLREMYSQISQTIDLLNS